ncbi:hypothetical protein [Secundilactobacillus folii]|uniref:DUF4064 domain-containing protein n=1 Tax=Secundilactobacillus folii TaxID=2678357 RepID=A0A7X2XZC6_9LACO|nr:hypothetical protein [Secundilactobacillus folii]MTV83121.1 hypothetical protein [Secundilactobacillus folii]
MKRPSPIQTVGWIVWWLELALTVGGLVLSLLGSLGASMMGGYNWSGSMMGGGMMGTNHWLYGFGMLFGLFWFAWRVVLQVVGYIAVQSLSNLSSLVWPIVLIVMGFLGGFLFLIPGVWAVIQYYQEPRDDNQQPRKNVQ